MSKEIQEKHFDVRVVNRYLKKGTLTPKDLESHYASLPNDEGNFELSVITEDDDDIGLGDELSDEEIEAMPAMTEDNIDDFDFIKKSDGSND